MIPEYIPDSSTFNMREELYSEVVKSCYRVGSKHFVSVKRNIPLMDIFYVIGFPASKYYFSKFISKLADGSILFVVKRVDGNFISSVDVDLLKSKAKLKISGTFNSKFIKDYQKPIR